METAKPILSQAKEFASGVKKVWPEKWLAYNLSPSFNWDAAGLSPQAMQDYVWELGKLGFVWQFITVSMFDTLCFKGCLSFLRLYSLVVFTQMPTSATSSPRPTPRKA